MPQLLLVLNSNTKFLIIYHINMEEEKVRQIIRDELFNLIGLDSFIFQKNIQILDGRNIQTGRRNGTKIATASDQKLGFYGVAPVDQPATVADPNDQGGTYSQTDAQTLTTAVKAIIDRLQELGLIST